MSNYDNDIKNFSDEEITLRPIAKDQITIDEKKQKTPYGCNFCLRYNNADSKGVLVHLMKSHKDILRLIKQSR